MVARAIEKNIYDDWEEVEEEVSYGATVLWKHIDGYMVAKATRGWGNTYNPNKTHKFALYLPDGKLLRAKKGSVTSFVDEYNAINRANKLIRRG